MNIIKVNHLYLIVTFFFLFFLSVFSFAQSNMPIQWQMCYGGSEVDVVYDMVQTENGFLVIGDTKSSDGNVSFNNGSSDIWIINIDSMGALIWERAYGGSSLDYHGRIIADLEGDYYFVGAVGSNDGDIQSNNHGDFDTWVVKIDASGEIIWEKCYGGSGREEVPGIILLSDGNLLITTNSTSDDGDLPAHYGVYDAWLFVISPYGEIIKSAVFGNDLHNHIYDVVETQDGGYFFISEASSTNGMVEGNYHGGMTDVWAVKTDSDMNIEWQMLYGGSAYDDGTLGLIELNDGYIFTAYTASNDGDVSGFHGGFNDIWVVRIDLEGNIIWQRCLGGSNTEYVGDISQTEDGGFVVFGSTESDNGDVSGNHSYPNWGWFDIWMVKLSSEGELEWQQCYGSFGDEKVFSGVIQKSDRNWVIAGSADYNSDDVSCSLHGEYVEDYWIFEIKDTTTNIITNQINDIEIKAYPNPATDYVVFELNSQGLKYNKNEIKIKNIFGQEVERLQIKSGKTIWDTRHLPSGIYIYTIDNLEFSKPDKIMITK